jgi:hypothetical protein
VRAWDLPEAPDPKTIDVSRYEELLLRAAHTILQILGVMKDVLWARVSSEEETAIQLRLPLIDCERLYL